MAWRGSHWVGLGQDWGVGLFFGRGLGCSVSVWFSLGCGWRVLGWEGSGLIGLAVWVGMRNVGLGGVGL